MEIAPRTVASLLGHAQVDLALACLGSLMRCSAEPLRLRLHDDGSLTGQDRDRLAEGLAGAEILAGAAADAEMTLLLAERPVAQAFRAANPLGRKLLDVPLLFPEEEVAYCDADVLFLRPFRGLFSLPDPGAGALFMTDPQNAYSVRSWHLLRESRLALPRRANTGVVVFRREHYDLDLIEWFLGRPELLRPPVWAEQTAWALLGQRAGCWLLDPAQVLIPDSRRPLPGHAVGLHLASPVRHLLAPALALADATASGAPVQLRRRPARSCGPLRLAAGELRRRLRRWRGLAR
jgi:hypothetical protein